MNDDYEMFGLDPDYATQKDAKKAYYNLSLLVHPDRNSCLDRKTGCAEMVAVQNAYRRIMKNIELRDETKIVNECDDLKELQKESQKELDELTEMPCFMDIFIETHDDIKKFHNAWEENKEKDRDEDDNLLQNNGYDIIPSEYAGNFSHELQYNPNIETDEPKIEHHITSNDNQIICIDDLESSNFPILQDYKEAFGIPEFLTNRIPKSCVEKYNDNNDVEKEFLKKSEELKNDVS
tara:strand:- start:10066 stop:10773 length:708 start_codon:yes stop_codon:yes gene_type:complete